MILAVLVVIGLLLYITDVKYFRHHHVGESNQKDVTSTNEEIPEGTKTAGDVCCGLHLVCEKTSLSITDSEIIYYDDEELDRYKGRKSDSYSYEEKEEFRDILLTMLPEDVAGWARSITLRGIELPTDVRDELFMIVNDLRNEKKRN